MMMGSLILRFSFTGFLFLTLLCFSFSQPVCHDDERSSLLQFKESFIINMSASYFSSLSYSKVAFWTNKEDTRNCCMWHGVECDEITGHVIGLDLSSSYLYGSIDSTSSLFDLTHLQSLDLADNHFNYSQIPRAIKRLSMLTNLNLSYSVFSGQIPSEVSELSKLSNLDLSYNIGKVPGENVLELKKPNNLETLVSNLTSLEKLHLSGVDISSAVPKSLDNLSSLKSLLLEDCKLTGEFPINIFQLPNLQSLNVMFNKDLTVRFPVVLDQKSSLKSLLLRGTGFSGDLPSSIEKLASLTELDGASCNFSGVIPASIGNIPQFTNGNQLRIIDFGYNLFEGKLSKSLTNCKMLGYLNVERNKLNDVFPYWLGSLRELRILILQANEFHGVIREPKTNHRQFAKLRIIDISFNSFNGRLPIEYIRSWKAMASTSAEDFEYMMAIPFDLEGNSGGLTLRMHYFFEITIAVKGRHRHYEEIQNIIAIINLSNNKFVGEIPEAIGNLKGLYSLDLSNNHLKGGIPSSLSNLRALESLDISQNALSGKIPVELDQLSFLQYFNVSHNQLSGSIPQYHLSTFEASSYEGNVGLCGMPLQNFCGHSSPPEHSFPSSEEESSYIFQFGWKVVAIGYGCGFLIGSFVGKIVIARKPNWLVMTFGIRS
ncbi:receptor-like protein 43 [Humulus lupulus]|uniref:receptor-like protein 43 n=1 Tax=Humulus lupulus TaxID=3486 RepID=UPI002B4083BE|nr:receptor-like protein 43 [Humulus lupulus]